MDDIIVTGTKTTTSVQADPAVSDKIEEAIDEEMNAIEGEEGEEGDDSENGEDEEGSKEDKPKRKSGHQRNKEKLERLQRELEETRAQKEQLYEMAMMAQQHQGLEMEKPKRSDYPGDEDGYLEAMLDYRDQMQERRFMQRRQEEEHGRKAKERTETWLDRIEATRDKYEDFDDVINQDLPVPPALQHALLESEIGPEVAYYFGKNPKELEKLAKISDSNKLLRLIGRIEAKLVDGVPTPKAVSVEVIRKPKGATSKKSARDMSDDEYLDWRLKGGGR